MRTFTFTLLAIAAGAAIQLGLGYLPYSVENALGKFPAVLMFVLPTIVTVGLAFAMRIGHVIYVYLLAIVSPFVTWAASVLFSVTVLHERFLMW